VIEVSHLSKQYGDVVAVEDVSFRAEKGVILGFLGPNGAGKTTTMRMLTCYLPPSSGEAKVAGFDILEESMEVRKRIGYLPEQPPVYHDMTVGAYLRFVAKIKGVPGPQLNGRLDDTMEKTGIAHHRDTVIGHLSKGYRQRVGLAQALVHEPDVLILDEPTVGLDPKQIIEIREVIKGLGGDHTVILSTHILPEVSMTCSQLVIINNGRIAGEGTPESLMAQLKEGEVLRAHIDGPTDEIRAMLQGLEGVLDVSSEPGEGIYLVTSAPGQDVRDALTKQVVDGGYSLRELRPLDMTLEDIFLSLTSEEVAA
jgi:ABC-2 type transport system ATP-binding protein|tara:strand:+ start:191 stop:1123 length:933 start_codon:yes stop_codon:yes gene_type:complete